MKQARNTFRQGDPHYGGQLSPHPPHPPLPPLPTKPRDPPATAPTLSQYWTPGPSAMSSGLLRIRNIDLLYGEMGDIVQASHVALSVTFQTIDKIIL